MRILVTAVLLIYASTLTNLADVAADPAAAGEPSPVLPSVSPVLHSGAVPIVLLIADALSVFKPRGLTPHGWSTQQKQLTQSPLTHRSPA